MNSFLETYTSELYRLYFKKKHIGNYDTLTNYNFNRNNHNYVFDRKDMNTIKKIKKIDKITELKIGDKDLSFLYDGKEIEILKDIVFYLKYNGKYIIRFGNYNLNDIMYFISNGVLSEIKDIVQVKENQNETTDMEMFKHKRMCDNIESYYNINTDVMALVNNYIHNSNTDVTVSVYSVLKSLSDEKLYKLYDEVLDIIKGDEMTDDNIRNRAIEFVKQNEAYELNSGAFKIYLKALNSILYDKKMSNDTLNDSEFMLKFIYNNVEINDFKIVIERYKSLDYVLSKIDYDNDDSIDLYIGITMDLEISYGFRKNGTEDINIGKFQFNKSIYSFLVTNEYKFFEEMRAILLNQDIMNIKTYCDVYKLILKNPIDNDTKVEQTNLTKETFDIVMNDEYGTWVKGMMIDQDYIQFKDHIANVLKNSKRINIQNVLYNIKAEKYKLKIRLKCN